MGAARARTTGRTSALKKAIRMTAITASMTRSTVRRGMIQAVSRNDTAATTSVISSRFTSATRPPRHSHSTRSCVP